MKIWVAPDLFYEIQKEEARKKKRKSGSPGMKKWMENRLM